MGILHDGVLFEHSTQLVFEKRARFRIPKAVVFDLFGNRAYQEVRRRKPQAVRVDIRVIY